ncbi:hypothetical protein C8R44DRAFT_79071 [Mycena epipterygia]|nr:hypothetical protein C8R44DRAFT_79071 [Mycena epipterygia]
MICGSNSGRNFLPSGSAMGGSNREGKSGHWVQVGWSGPWSTNGVFRYAVAPRKVRTRNSFSTYNWTPTSPAHWPTHCASRDHIGVQVRVRNRGWRIFEMPWCISCFNFAGTWLRSEPDTCISD